MPIQLTCPSCQRQLRVPDNLVGQMVKCPGCKEAFKAVVEEAPPPEEPKPSRRPPDDDDRYREEQPERRPSRRDEDEDLDDDDDRGGRRRRRNRRSMVPHRGTMILVLGILGLVAGLGIGTVCGIIAWIMGKNDLNEIRAGRMDPEGESMTNVGRILGMVSCAFHAVGLFVCCPIWIIAMIASNK